MTDAEKMLELMGVLGTAARGETQTQFDNVAQLMKMSYDSYIKAGFSSKMAFELTKTLLIASIQGTIKK